MARKKSKIPVLIGLLVFAGLVFTFYGCAKKPMPPVIVEEEVAVAEVGPAVVVEKEVIVEEGGEIVAEEVEVEVATPAADCHTVRKGECLWCIAEYANIYSDPYMWPLIYDANKEQIKNPDLIYPGQELQIPRTGYNLEEIQALRSGAGAPRPYIPPAEANLPTSE